MSKHEKILDDLAKGVAELDANLTRSAALEAVVAEMDAQVAIDQGLVRGMSEAGRLYEQEEYFVPELLIASDSLNVGLEILTPHLPRAGDGKRARMVLGVVQGDTHDIGKNLVRIMLDVGNFDVIDLGRDVPAEVFVAKAKEFGADILGLSTLMTTTMPQMARVIDLLRQEGIRDQIKVIVGGGPISAAFAGRIGADGYADNATSAVRVARDLLQKQPQAEIA